MQTRDQFLRPNRLDDKIVAASIQSFDLVLPASARTQDQDRIGETPFPPPGDQFDTAHAGKAEIHNQGRELLGIGPVQRCFRIRRMFDNETSGRKPRHQSSGYFRVIFNKENPHCGPSFDTALPDEAAPILTIGRIIAGRWNVSGDDAVTSNGSVFRFDFDAGALQKFGRQDAARTYNHRIVGNFENTLLRTDRYGAHGNALHIRLEKD